MNNQLDSPGDKLREGQHLLSTAANDEYRLSAALLTLHGALEDRLRELLSSRLPDKKSDIMDKSSFQWKDILQFSEEYLGLSRADSDFISIAGKYRNRVAHGNKFEWNRVSLCQYEELIREVWISGSRRSAAPVPSASSRYAQPQQPKQEPGISRPEPPLPIQRSNTITAPKASPTYQRVQNSQTPVYTPQSLPVYTTTIKRPWYRSPAFYWFTFLFFFPVWFLMILTDSSKRCLVKALAFLMIPFYLSGVYLAWSNLIIPGIIEAKFNIPAVYNEPVPSIDLTETPDPKDPLSTQILATVTNENCQIIWVEYQGNDLAKKNRSIVWNEIVSKQVTGSGMDPKQFYKEVVDNNPVLKTDGYEFKQGKTYLLPRCK